MCVCLCTAAAFDAGLIVECPCTQACALVASYFLEMQMQPPIRAFHSTCLRLSPWYQQKLFKEMILLDDCVVFKLFLKDHTAFTCAKAREHPLLACRVPTWN